jgi:hypothetical protein
MNIQPTYVTFEQAKLLKEKGFKELVRVVYKNEDGWWEVNGVPYNHNYFDGVQSAPEQWQIVEWLRVEKGIYIRATDVQGTDLDYKMVIRPLSSHWNYKSERLFKPDWYIMEFQGNSPQEAYSAAFDYILKELI